MTRLITILATAFVTLSTFAGDGSILYVDDDAIGANDGTSWEDAYRDLQDALAFAGWPGGVVLEIRIAGGVYKPSQTGDPGKSFKIVSGVSVRGGFAGVSSPDPNYRDIALFETILTGDLSSNDGPSFENTEENTWHVVTALGPVDEGTTWDGLTITGGSTFGGNSRGGAGALLAPANSASCRPTFSHCSFQKNQVKETIAFEAPNAYGGAVLSRSGAKPNFVACHFLDNRAPSGGAVGCGPIPCGDPLFNECLFENNTANGSFNPFAGRGGAIEGRATLNGCIFRNNSANASGGALAGLFNAHRCQFELNSSYWAGCIDGLGNFKNCTFYQNQSVGPYGAGVIGVDYDHTAVFDNCLFLGNRSESPDEGGGAVAVYPWGLCELINCTVVGNSAKHCGPAVRSYPESQLVIRGSIIWGNTDNSGLFSPQLCTSSNAEVFMDYSCLEGDFDEFGGVGNTGDDPLFIDPIGPDGIPASGDENFRLSYESPLINAGDPDFDDDPLLADLDGHARILCDRVDMGAYEFGIGDVDCNGLINIEIDYATFHVCLTKGFDFFCIPLDFDMSESVDLLDFAGFQNHFLTP